MKLSSRSAALSEALLGQIKIARHSPFLRDVFVVGGGTAAAQGIAIVFLPIISRLYSPETFGYYNLLVTSTLLLVPLATLRYEAMIQVVRTNRAAGQILWLNFMTSIAMAAMVLAIFRIFRQPIENFLRLQQIPLWWLFVPGVMLLTAVHEAMRNWIMRQRRFSAAARSAVARSTLFSVLASLAPSFSKGAGTTAGLTVAHAAAELARNWVLLTALRAPGMAQPGRPRSRYVSAMARRHGRAVLALLGVTFVVMIYERLPYFMISTYFGAAALGYYGMAERILSMASQLVSGAVGDVYRQRASELLRANGEFGSLTRKTIATTACVAVVPFGLAVIFSPAIFAAALGPLWKPAGEFASIMLIGEFFAFVLNPIAQATVLVGAAKYLLLINAARLVMTIALLPLLYFHVVNVHAFLGLLVAVRISIVLTEGVVAYLCSIKGKPIFG